MLNELKLDEKLWFYHNGCEGKHYLLGNPHTFTGRIHAWCGHKKSSFCVSLSEIESMSEVAKYWIKGYLKGNEPEPPRNEDGDVVPESLEYKNWVESLVLFSETGFWSSFERNCEKCNSVLLNSEEEEICAKCRA